MIGKVKLTVRDNGKVCKELTSNNLVVKGGRALIAQSISGKNKENGTFFFINQVGLGTGSSAKEDSNSALTDPVVETLLPTDSVISDANPYAVVFTKTISLKDKGTSGTKTVREAGLYYTQNNQNILFSRYTFPDITLQYNDSHDISLEVEWTISIPSTVS